MTYKTIKSLFCLPLIISLFTGCAHKQDWPGYPHEKIVIPGDRLAAGDLRYNIRIYDGDIIYPSAEPIFPLAKPLAPPVDRVRPSEIGTRSYGRPYYLKTGDTLLITIYELRVPGVDDVQTRQINVGGGVRLNIVGPMTAEGLSASELERSIAEKLQASGKLRDATVSVRVLEGGPTYQLIGVPVAYIGAGDPNTRPINSSGFRLLQAIEDFGGIPRASYKHIYIIRQTER